MGAAVGGPQIFTKADAIKGAITVTKDNGVVKDVVVNKPELASAITVVKDGNVVKDVVFQETDTVKGIKVDVKKKCRRRYYGSSADQGCKIRCYKKPCGRNY